MTTRLRESGFLDIEQPKPEPEITWMLKLI